jgi:hypothetical protein
MRAPQYRRVTERKGPGERPRYDLPPGPNPALKKGLRVEPWANVFALVEGLSVLSLHPKREGAEAALLERAKRHQPETDR